MYCVSCMVYLLVFKTKTPPYHVIMVHYATLVVIPTIVYMLARV